MYKLKYKLVCNCLFLIILQKKKECDEAQKETKEESESIIKLRPLNMEDMRQAKNQVIYFDPSFRK